MAARSVKTDKNRALGPWTMHNMRRWPIREEEEEEEEEVATEEG